MSGLGGAWRSLRPKGNWRQHPLPHVFPGDPDGYQSWTRDTPLGRGLAKGTPTTGKPGPVLTTSTTRSPGHPSAAPRARGDTGEALAGARAWGTRCGAEGRTPNFPHGHQKDPAEMCPQARGSCLQRGGVWGLWWTKAAPWHPVGGQAGDSAQPRVVQPGATPQVREGGRKPQRRTSKRCKQMSRGEGSPRGHVYVDVLTATKDQEMQRTRKEGAG